MKKTSLSAPSSRENLNGYVYFAIQLLLLPPLFTWANGQFSHPLSDAELNFAYYMVNFITVALIFHDFLARSLSQALHHPAYLCQAVILGLAAYYACRWATQALIGLLIPTFTNYNDASIAAMSQGNYFLMVIGTVVLVPPVEECFYRGLIFRGLYGKVHWVGYLVSMVAFAAIHTIGYLGIYSPLELAVALLQYLPAGLCLAWSYAKAGTIFAPIIIHGLINFLTIRTMR